MAIITIMICYAPTPMAMTTRPHKRRHTQSSLRLSHRTPGGVGWRGWISRLLTTDVIQAPLQFHLQAANSLLRLRPPPHCCCCCLPLLLALTLALAHHEKTINRAVQYRVPLLLLWTIVTGVLRSSHLCLPPRLNGLRGTARPTALKQRAPVTPGAAQEIEVETPEAGAGIMANVVNQGGRTGRTGRERRRTSSQKKNAQTRSGHSQSPRVAPQQRHLKSGPRTWRRIGSHIKPAATLLICCSFFCPMPALGVVVPWVADFGCHHNLGTARGRACSSIWILGKRKRRRGHSIMKILILKGRGRHPSRQGHGKALEEEGIRDHHYHPPPPPPPPPPE